MYVWPCHQLVVAFIRHEARAEYPLIHLSVLARPNIAVAALLIFIYPGFGTTAASFVLPDYLTRVQGLRALGKAQRSTAVIGGCFPPEPFLKDALPEVPLWVEKGNSNGGVTRIVAGARPAEGYLLHMLRLAFVVLTLTMALVLTPSAAIAFDLFATHEVTVQFATQDGKPLANAEVQVFAPGDAKTPAGTGRTDAQGKFVFEADQDGFWSAEAKGADQVARVMIRVSGEAQTSQSRISPFIVIGVLAVLLAVAIWYRLLRARNRRPRS